MKSRLVYTHFVSGHNVEYLHHLYLGALEDKEHRYVFAVPYAFVGKKHLMEWEPSDRISFHYLDQEAFRTGNILMNAWRNCKRLRQTVRQTGADEVILISLMDFMPFIQLLLPRNVSVRGILYRIYLYYLADMSWMQRMQEWVKFWIITHSTSIRQVFVLNDEDSAAKLNRRWDTDKFCYLPDPYLPLDESQLRDMRQELGISPKKKIVLHVGSINYNKGFDKLFDMIDHSSKSDLQDYCFIFAGVVANEVKELFYSRLERGWEKAEIVVRDKFLSYQELGSLVYTADKVVLPYRRFGQSSGIIAYCAQLQTPVYVPGQGLVGKLVEKYNIGLGVKEFNDIHSVEKELDVIPSYCECHRVADFYQILLGLSQ